MSTRNLPKKISKYQRLWIQSICRFYDEFLLKVDFSLLLRDHISASRIYCKIIRLDFFIEIVENKVVVNKFLVQQGRLNPDIVLCHNLSSSIVGP